ncbi:PP2C family protein-serine/threonine phosphatase [Longispora fulva]|uniref:Protein phosphatase n=1 Tax=Longispora fulva TaxID=619741 RepID=A0A8J7KLV4_9ACTN|nr:protein phosphatase 2C domain-containing protein [Longispora fulva]MBG6139819.1 protein phosphatase [Longispora fulva]
MRSGTASDAGRVRELNEDSSLTMATMFAVADGMGGHAAGEVASRLAVARLGRLGDRPGLKPADVRAELALANEEILASAAAHPERAGMGTTVAGLCLLRFAGSEHWVVFNIGDSRVYRFAEDSLSRMTVDHSEVEELVAAGVISAAEAREHPRRNVVTRALGMDPAPDADLWMFPPTPGERFLICSDGLSTELGDPEIAAVLWAEPVAQRAARTLVRLAVEAGGRDNVTVVVVDHVACDDDTASEDTLPRSQAVETR